MKDIEGIIRVVVGYSKMPDEDGDCLVEVEYKLRPINIDFLRKLFNVNLSSKDQTVLDMINPIKINNDQAIGLQPYVIEGCIDLDKYTFMLECFQDEAYDWSQGYAIKKE